MSRTYQKHGPARSAELGNPPGRPPREPQHVNARHVSRPVTRREYRALAALFVTCERG